MRMRKWAKEDLPYIVPYSTLYHAVSSFRKAFHPLLDRYPIAIIRDVMQSPSTISPGHLVRIQVFREDRGTGHRLDDFIGQVA